MAQIKLDRVEGGHELRITLPVQQGRFPVQQEVGKKIVFQALPASKMLVRRTGIVPIFSCDLEMYEDGAFNSLQSFALCVALGSRIAEEVLRQARLKSWHVTRCFGANFADIDRITNRFRLDMIDPRDWR